MNRILIHRRRHDHSRSGRAPYRHGARTREARSLQFYVNTEIGSLTAGSAACAGTKDASFAAEFGQVGSYVIGAKLVLPNGELLEVTEAQPELMQKVAVELRPVRHRL